MPRFSRRHLLAALAATPLLTPASTHAAPRSRLIDGPWTTFGTRTEVDNQIWTEFLAAFLRPGADGVTRLAYGGVSDSDKMRLQTYLNALAALEPATLSKPAAFAYWANLYNALTVSLVLEEYPVDSIKEVRGGLFNTGPWDEKAVTVAGRRLSLDDIEHGILRPVFRDPRVHYAVNCASIGCPNLAPTPFNAATLEPDLDTAARAYVNHPRGARLDPRGRLIVSSIYEWFQEDFGGDDAGVVAHLRRYANPELATKLQTVADIYDDEYDWALNDAPRA